MFMMKPLSLVRADNQYIPLVVSLSNHEQTARPSTGFLPERALILRQAQDERRVEGLTLCPWSPLRDYSDGPQLVRIAPGVIDRGSITV
jgi:hypothetical protein